MYATRHSKRRRVCERINLLHGGAIALRRLHRLTNSTKNIK